MYVLHRRVYVILLYISLTARMESAPYFVEYIIVIGVEAMNAHYPHPEF